MYAIRDQIKGFVRVTQEFYPLSYILAHNTYSLEMYLSQAVS